MNRTEARILREATRRVAHHNEHLWWELKRQIWEFGYQPYYPRQGEYALQAKIAVNLLSEQAFEELRITYSAQNKDDPHPSRDRLVEYYSMLMIGEIVRRAGIAAYRTENW